MSTLRGAASVTSPGTTMQVSDLVSFGVTFASAPTVLTTDPITAAGVVVDTHPVSISTTNFTIRYRANSTVATTPVSWIAIGVLA